MICTGMSNNLILIVDDTPSNMLYMSYLLRSFGYAVVEAVDGEQAMTYLHTGELPALVVTDMFMPHVSGYDLVMRMRSEFSLMAIPVVFTTAMLNMEAMAVLASAAQVRHVIFIPATPDVILTTIRAAMLEARASPASSRHVVLGEIIAELRRFAKGLPLHDTALLT